MVTKPIITSVSNLPPITIHSYERYLPTAFDESLSILQKMNKLINHLNEIGEVSNNLVKQWNELMQWIIGNGLTDIVSDEIDKRIADGTFNTLIYNIVGDLTLLETTDQTDMVNALNEVFRIADTNDKEIGVLTDLQTTDQTSIVKAINEIKTLADVHLQAPISMAESTGHGVVSGFKVTQQKVLAMAVEIGDYVTPNILHLPNGVRYTLDSIALPVKPSHATLGRKDIIYVDGQGVISYLDGVNSNFPVAPNLPDGSVLLAEILVDPTDTTVNDIDITDKRQIKSLTELLTKNKSNLVQAINEIITSLNDVINTAIGDVAKLPTSDKTSIVNAIIEVVNESATKLDVANEIGDRNTLKTTEQTTIVKAINEVIDESATKIDVANEIGDKTTLKTSDQTTIVKAINEVIDESATKIDVATEIGDKTTLKTSDQTSIVKAINEVIDESATKIDVQAVEKVVGDKATLKTSDQTSIVNAINEVLNSAVNNAIVGDVKNLNTTDKTTIVNSINEVNSRLSNVLDVTPEQFGAVGDGVTDDYQAFKKMVDYVNSKKGGVISFKNGATYFIATYKKTADVYAGMQPTFTNLDYIKLNGNGATISMKGDIHRDSFNVIPLTALDFKMCNNVIIDSLTLNGNVDKMTKVAGVPESPSHGLRVYGCTNVVLTNIHSHHFSADGFIIGGIAPTPNSKNVFMLNCKSLYNARQGFSVTGVKDMLVVNSEFSLTGKSTGTYGFHMPCAGIDFEPEVVSDTQENIVFENCKIRNNFIGQVICTHGWSYAKNISMVKCLIEVEGSPLAVNAMNICAENFVFDSCVLNGVPLWGAYGYNTTEVNNSLIVRNCDIAFKGGYTEPGSAMYFISAVVYKLILFDGNRITFTDEVSAYPSSSPLCWFNDSKKIEFRNNKIVAKKTDNVMPLIGVILMQFEGNIDVVSYNNIFETNIPSNVNNGSFGIPTAKLVNEGLNNVFIGSIGFQGKLKNKHYSINNSYKNVQAFAPNTGIWEVGDVVWNSVVSSGGYMGWICTATAPLTFKGFGLVEA